MLSEFAVLIEGLEYSYVPQGPNILKISRLEIKTGEKVLVVGPSGVGKSTLLSLLSGVLTSKRGSVIVGGENISLKTPSERDQFRGNNLGLIFQQFNLVSYLSVKENIELGVLFSEERKSRVLEKRKSVEGAALELARGLGIEEFFFRKCSELSVGQQQRVAAARALIGSPKLVVADEPTSALDKDTRDVFLKLLFKMCDEAGSTLICVSHDEALAKYFTRVIDLGKLQKS